MGANVALQQFFQQLDRGFAEGQQKSQQQRLQQQREEEAALNQVRLQFFNEQAPLLLSKLGNENARLEAQLRLLDEQIKTSEARRTPRTFSVKELSKLNLPDFDELTQARIQVALEEGNPLEIPAEDLPSIIRATTQNRQARAELKLQQEFNTTRMRLLEAERVLTFSRSKEARERATAIKQKAQLDLLNFGALEVTTTSELPDETGGLTQRTIRQLIPQNFQPGAGGVPGVAAAQGGLPVPQPQQDGLTPLMIDILRNFEQRAVPQVQPAPQTPEQRVQAGIALARRKFSEGLSLDEVKALIRSSPMSERLKREIIKKLPTELELSFEETKRRQSRTRQ